MMWWLSLSPDTKDSLSYWMQCNVPKWEDLTIEQRMNILVKNFGNTLK